MPKEQHKKRLHDNVIKRYKKTTLIRSINKLRIKSIAELINLDDRIECIAKTPAFTTLKDHKPDFRQNLSCQLINPHCTENNIFFFQTS